MSLIKKTLYHWSDQYRRTAFVYGKRLACQNSAFYLLLGCSKSVFNETYSTKRSEFTLAIIWKQEMYQICVAYLVALSVGLWGTRDSVVVLCLRHSKREKLEVKRLQFFSVFTFKAAAFKSELGEAQVSKLDPGGAVKQSFLLKDSELRKARQWFMTEIPFIQILHLLKTVSRWIGPGPRSQHQHTFVCQILKCSFSKWSQVGTYFPVWNQCYIFSCLKPMLSIQGDVGIRALRVNVAVKRCIIMRQIL